MWTTTTTDLALLRRTCSKKMRLEFEASDLKMCDIEGIIECDEVRRSHLLWYRAATCSPGALQLRLE